MTIIAYALTSFVLGVLLLSLQPMTSKVLLPVLVGNEANFPVFMIAVAAAQLGGFLYALVAYLAIPWRLQVPIHLSLVAMSLGLLARGVGGAETLAMHDTFNLYAQFIFPVVLFPTFVLWSSILLVQSWFSQTNLRSAQDPYFLFSFAALGTLVAFTAYPLLIEPNLPVNSQLRLLVIVYPVPLACMAICAAFAWSAAPKCMAASEGSNEEAIQSQAVSRPLFRVVPEPSINLPGVHFGAWDPVRWVVFAAVPAGLYIALTTFLTTRISSIPLFGLISGALYQLTIVLAFMKWLDWWGRWLPLLVPLWMLLAIILMAGFKVVGAESSIWTPVSLLLVSGFFVVALVFHSALARHRPPVRHLVLFYLCMVIGEVVGWGLGGWLYSLVEAQAGVG